MGHMMGAYTSGRGDLQCHRKRPLPIDVSPRTGCGCCRAHHLPDHPIRRAEDEEHLARHDQPHHHQQRRHHHGGNVDHGLEPAPVNKRFTDEVFRTHVYPLMADLGSAGVISLRDRLSYPRSYKGLMLDRKGQRLDLQEGGLSCQAIEIDA